MEKVDGCAETIQECSKEATKPIASTRRHTVVGTLNGNRMEMMKN